MRIKTLQTIASDAGSIEGLPLRDWKIEVWMLGPDGEVIAADIFERCVYRLHPTFTTPVRTKIGAPFTLKEKGWGEFTMTITCAFLRGGGQVEFLHELSFEDEVYYMDFLIKVPCHIPELRQLLERSGPVVLAEPHDNVTYTAGTEKWVQTLSGDSELATDVVNKIVHHPAVMREIEKLPLEEPFVMDLRQLPASLLEDIGKYVMDEPSPN